MSRNQEAFRTPMPVHHLFGQPGLRLHQVRPIIDHHYQAISKSAYLVLEIGANDVTMLSSKVWRKELEELVLYLRVRFPWTRLVWSDMLPRLNWRHAHSASEATKPMRRQQRWARVCFLRERGSCIKHPNILADRHCLLADGVHLSDEGQARFFLTISVTQLQRSLKVAILLKCLYLCQG